MTQVGAKLGVEPLQWMLTNSNWSDRLERISDENYLYQSVSINHLEHETSVAEVKMATRSQKYD